MTTLPPLLKPAEYIRSIGVHAHGRPP